MLLVTSDLPYDSVRHGGGQLTVNLVRHLSREHELTLLSFLREEDEPFLEETRRWFSAIHTVPARRGWGSRFRRLGMLLRHPYPVVATHSRRMIERVRELSSSGEFDLVQFEYFHMGQYLPFVPREVRRVLVLTDVVTPVLRQQIRIARGLNKARLYREWELSRYWEKWFAIWAGTVFTLSLKDRRTVDSWDVGVKTAVLPPLLGEEFFRVSREPAGSGEILFVGAMHRPVNRDAAEILRDRVLPRVRETRPEARCLVVGQGSPAGLRTRPEHGFIVTGGVESLRPFLERADLFAAPLRAAGGIIVKILQAMAAGVPVVASRCANAGIGARDGKEILLADEPARFAGAAAELLSNPERAREVGEAGRAFIRRHFDPAGVKLKIDRLYRRVLEKQS